MADTFDCPRCGAPVKYNSAEQGYLETISCPYCGESIVIPAEMRPQPPASQPHAANQEERELVKEVLQEERGTGPNPYQQPAVPYSKPKQKNGIINCIIWAAILVPLAIILIAVFFFVIALSTNSSSSSSATATPGNIAATRAVQNELFSAQRNWPVVIQEGFTDDKLNWTTGLDNNNLAVEQKTISDGKYTWQFVSKQSVGSFTYPDMPIQKDIFISVDVQMTATSHTQDDRAGIVFRHSPETKSFYFFGVSDGSFTLSMYDGSGWNNLIEPTPSALIKSDQVNHLAVSMTGDQILLQINNQIVGEYEDNRLASGIAGVGINLSGAGKVAQAIFTNFYVRAPQQ